MTNVPAWLVFASGSAFFAGLTAVLAKLGVAGINSNLATFVRTAVVLLLSAGIVSLRGEWVWPKQGAELRPLVFLVLSGVATGLSWLCYFRALQLAPVSVVAPVDKLSVAFAIVLGVLVLGEPFTWRLALGAVLIVGGVLLIAGG